MNLLKNEKLKGKENKTLKKNVCCSIMTIVENVSGNITDNVSGIENNRRYSMKKQVNWRKQEYIPMPAKEKALYEIHSIEEIPRSELYRVFHNGETLPVFHTEFFDYVLPVIHEPGNLEFCIQIQEKFEKIEIRPNSKKYKFTVQGEELQLTIKKPERFIVEIDDDLLRPLYVLCSEYIPKPEQVTYYFEKGRVYNVDCLTLHTNDTVYIEEGSIVCGKIFSRMANHVTILGNGILYGSVWHKWDENSGDQMFRLILGEDIYLEGISIVDGGSWGIVPIACKNVTIRNVNVMSKVITGDGVDIVGCENVLLEDCFIRTNDDCISIKGCGNMDPSGCSDVKHVLVRNSLFWNAEFGNALEIGYETMCSEICDIRFDNCDIVHCEYEGNQSGGVLTIHNADRAHVHDVYYENIRIEDAQEKFVDIKTLDSKYSTNRRRGMVNNIYFKNIEVTGGVFPVSIIRGFEMADELCRPKDFYFENVVILGKKVMNKNDMHMVVELSDDLHFQ